MLETPYKIRLERDRIRRYLSVERNVVQEVHVYEYFSKQSWHTHSPQNCMLNWEKDMILRVQYDTSRRTSKFIQEVLVRGTWKKIFDLPDLWKYIPQNPLLTPHYTKLVYFSIIPVSYLPCFMQKILGTIWKIYQLWYIFLGVVGTDLMYTTYVFTARLTKMTPTTQDWIHCHHWWINRSLFGRRRSSGNYSEDDMLLIDRSM